MSLGLFIGRLNPPHIWHIWIIKRVLKEIDKALILLWTPLFNTGKDPFDFEKRKKILKSIFFDEKLIILELNDNKSNLKWISKIKEIIKFNIDNTKKINFYGWDFKNDSSYSVIKEYKQEFIDFDINYIENSRKNSFIEYCWKQYKVSATNLRKALQIKDYKMRLL